MRIRLLAGALFSYLQKKVTLIHCIAGEKEEASPIVIENKIKELKTEFDRLLVLAVDKNDIIDHKLKQINETTFKLKQQKKWIEYTAECSEVMEFKAKEVMGLISAEDLAQQNTPIP